MKAEQFGQPFGPGLDFTQALDLLQVRSVLKEQNNS
jgi:hypothetical protein